MTDGAGTEPLDDARSISAARRGDRSAFELLCERYCPMVPGILLSRVPVRDVEDLVQDSTTLILSQAIH